MRIKRFTIGDTIDPRGIRPAMSPGSFIRGLLMATVVGAGLGCGDAEPAIPAVVEVSPASATLQSLEQNIQLTAAVQDQNGQTMTGVTIAWTSGDVSVASVSTAGIVTARGNGTATVTATSGSATGHSAVTVRQVVAEVGVAPSTDTLTAFGDTVRLVAEARDANGHIVGDAVFSWASGNEPAVTVDSAGLATARGSGTATVTATSGPATGHAAVMVRQVAAEVGVAPSTDTLTAFGDTVRLVAEARDANGHIVDDAVFSWASGNEPAVTVDSAGLATARGNGTATVTASAGKALGEAAVTVRQSVDSVMVTPASAAVVLGTRLRLNAEGFDGNGHLVDGTLFEWGSSDAQVASVDAGLVTGVARGAATITASAGSAHGTSGITVVESPDRAKLVALYEATDGPTWTEHLNWTTDTPLGRWFGVKTGSNGLVTELALPANNLRGAIPAELGNLSNLRRLDLYGNGLTGNIPPELGNLSTLVLLHLARNRLAGEIPPELGNLANLGRLYLFGNGLTGEIPPELGLLTSVQSLALMWNRLTGEIPPELGDLANLSYLHLGANELTGEIPPELGGLATLRYLHLGGNGLTGEIPPELGSLGNLWYMHLGGNGLTGEIPPELGDLARLEELYLDYNQLSGPIPGELGALGELSVLVAHENELTGDLPPELGNLGSLEDLVLNNNDLSGPVPPEFGGLADLRQLDVTNNARMRGALPEEATELEQLDILLAGGTGLCAPPDEDFREWLKRIHRRRIASCAEPAVVYLTQAVQSREFPVPLVAGEKALLRVFLTAAESNQADIPGVWARFHADGKQIHSQRIPGKSGPIPTEVDEGDLSKSVNAEIGGDMIRTGLEMVIEVDSVDAGLGVPRRIPETGRLAVEIDSVPLLDLTAIPFLWKTDPDSSIIGLVEAVSREPGKHSLLADTRTLLPVADIEVTAHDPVESSTNNAFQLLYRTRAIRVMEGGEGHYMGTMAGRVTGAGGVAFRPGRSNFSVPVSHIVAHELGHNMSLFHAPCGRPAGVDPAYPYSDGSIGAWGYDFEAEELVGNTTRDLMSYCRPSWISDYHFSNALRFRESDADSAGLPGRSAAPVQGLLLWGGIDGDGVPFLEPAFVVDAPPALPPSGGEYTISGRSDDGAELFSIRFDMPVTADADGRTGFAFVLPVQPGWEEALADLTLAGPAGSATLDRESEMPMAILRSLRNGQVRGILGNLPGSTLTRSDAAALLSPAPGLVLRFSRGIPDTEAWRR